MKSVGKACLAGAVAAIVVAASSPAHALRCASRLISEGDHATRLLRYCGEPAHIQSRLAQRALVGNIGNVLYPGFFEDVTVEEWTYNFGPHKFMQIVRVENGIVTDIRGLGYGFLRR